MKTKIKIIVISLFIGIFTPSCDHDDDPDKPVISDLELGTDNSKTGYLKDDLHIQAEVVAEGIIDKLEVSIYMDNEEDAAWEFDSVFTEFSGYKSKTFHKHIDIPEDADTGTYIFKFIVTDLEGFSAVVEEELYVSVPTDSVAPEITISSAPENGATYTNDETISISGTITDDQKLGGLYIGLIREDQEYSDSEVNATNTITILHTHDFEEGDTYDFSASIVVGASEDNNITPKKITDDIAWQSASYYILVKCKDAYAGNWTFSNHYPVTINYSKK